MDERVYFVSNPAVSDHISRDDALYGVQAIKPEFAVQLGSYPWWHWRNIVFGWLFGWLFN